MAMWQHMFGVYVWRSVWRCKLGAVQLTSPQNFSVQASFVNVL